jgi:ABC-type multidrug transport system fused ATPase/permease subunit
MSVLFDISTKFFNENRFRIIIIVCLILLINLIQINALSYITANIISSIQKKDKNIVFNNYKIFIIVYLIYILIYYFYKYLQNNILIKIRGWSKNEIFKMLFIINNKEYNDINFTNFSSGINKFTGLMFTTFNNIVNYLIPNITLLFVIFLYFFLNNYYFGTIFLIGNIILYLYIYIKWNSMVEAQKIYEISQIDNDIMLNDSLNNFEKIIYRNQHLNEINNFKNKIDLSIDKGNKFLNNVNLNNFYVNIILYTLICILILYLIILYYNNNIKINIFITFFTILLLYRDRITILFQQIPDYLEFAGKENILYNYLNDKKYLYENDKNDKNYIENNNNLQFNKIEFKNVYFKYNDKKYIFNDLNIVLDINNKIIGFIGLSGNGKSTFVKLLIKMYKYEGNILIDDISINNINTEYIIKNITYVNQNSKLFDKNLYDNIFYGCNKNISKKYLEEIFQYKNIKNLFRNVDFNKNIGLNGEKLSGGQRQVINIINGLITPSKIIILDEPTNALDPELKKEIIEIIKYFRNYKKCIIIISHDKDIYNIFDKTINF